MRSDYCFLLHWRRKGAAEATAGGSDSDPDDKATAAEKKKAQPKAKKTAKGDLADHAQMVWASFWFALLRLNMLVIVIVIV